MPIRVDSRTLIAWLWWFVGAVLGPAFIVFTAWRLGREARPLTETELAMLTPYFAGPLLARVRVAELPRIALTPVRAINRRLMSPAGLTLGPLVVLRDDLRGARRDRVLFHEVVHVRQYRRFGLRGFAARYLAGWAHGGYRYRGIPLEREAHEEDAAFAARRAGGHD